MEKGLGKDCGDRRGNRHEDDDFGKDGGRKRGDDDALVSNGRTFIKNIHTRCILKSS